MEMGMIIAGVTTSVGNHDSCARIHDDYHWCHGAAMALPWRCHGAAMALPWRCDGNLMEPITSSNGNTCVLPSLPPQQN